MGIKFKEYLHYWQVGVAVVCLFSEEYAFINLKVLQLKSNFTMSSVGDPIDIRGYGRRGEDGRLESGDFAYLMK